MKAATFTWFANGMQNSAEQAVWSLPAMTIKGFQLSLSGGALDWPWFQQGTYAVFDFQAMISNTAGWPTNLNQIGQLVSLKQVAGSNPPPSFDPGVGSPINDGALASTYLIVQEPNEHGNQTIIVPYGGITVPVPAVSYLLHYIAHSGGKATFAAKMVLYYDPS